MLWALNPLFAVLVNSLDVRHFMHRSSVKEDFQFSCSIEPARQTYGQIRTYISHEALVSKYAA